MDTTVGQVMDICYSQPKVSTESGTKKTKHCNNCEFYVEYDKSCKIHNTVITFGDCTCSKFLKKGDTDMKFFWDDYPLDDTEDYEV